MSINYAILGILSWKPMTGYDLKKIIQDSSFMYWSANNNQIYRSLVELHNEGYVTYEVEHQDSSPSKKIYTITEEGLAELKEWVLSRPEPPEYKKTFLIQLAWAHELRPQELNTLLSNYENEIRMQLISQKEKIRRGYLTPGRTQRESYLWNMIEENLCLTYETELAWLGRIREDLGINMGEETQTMSYMAQVNNNKKYIEYLTAKEQVSKEQDALDLIGICGEHDTNLLLLSSEVLAADFFKLKTGLAGQIMQKLANYQVKTALLLSGETKITGKFKDLKIEINRGNAFRIFDNKDEAVNWLTR